MTQQRLVTFLYLLMRDKLPTGEVENLLKEAEKARSPVFSAIYLENYARELAKRISASPPSL